MLHPTGPGESRTLSDPENIVFNNAGWLDASHVIGFGQKIGERSQGYIQDINGGPPRRFTPEGATVKVPTWWSLPISPDGRRVVATDEHDAAMIYAVDGGAPQPVPHLNAGDVVVQWSSVGHGLLVAHRDGLAVGRGAAGPRQRSADARGDDSCSRSRRSAPDRVRDLARCEILRPHLRAPAV
jgi:hypothetical protein